MIEQKDITPIGKFQKTHALKGELNAILDIDAEYILEGNAIIVEIDGIYVPFYTSGIRSKGQTSYLIKLNGIETESEAKQFVNKIIYASKQQLAPFFELSEEEIINDSELLGYKIVEIEDEKTIGTVVEIDSSTSNLLFIVESPDGKKIFIPAVDDFIQKIDDKNRIIRMSLPSGLIDLN